MWAAQSPHGHRRGRKDRGREGGKKDYEAANEKMGSCCITQGPRVVGWVGEWDGVSYVYLCPVHVVVWQKSI